MRMAPTPSEMNVVVTMSRRVKIPSGMIGSAALCSMSTKATRATAPRVKAAKLGTEAHAQACPPSRSARMIAVNPIVSVTAPA